MFTPAKSFKDIPVTEPSLGFNPLADKNYSVHNPNLACIDSIVTEVSLSIIISEPSSPIKPNTLLKNAISSLVAKFSSVVVLNVYKSSSTSDILCSKVVIASVNSVLVAFVANSVLISVTTPSIRVLIVDTTALSSSLLAFVSS
jgi:hypothetical protein